jgi:hypothetical protein
MVAGVVDFAKLVVWQPHIAALIPIINAISRITVPSVF